MINYLKSDLFRLSKKKSGYILLLILTVSQILLAISLEFFQRTEPGFPYGTTKFFYSNIFGSASLLLILVCFLSNTLLGKDRKLIPTSIALGITRKDIFIGKFILTLFYTIFVLFILGGITYLIGETIISNTDSSVAVDYIISLVNLAPILLSSFVVAYSCTFIFDSEIASIIVVLLCYRILALIITGLAQIFTSISVIETYFPANALNDILTNFMSGNVHTSVINWLVNIFIAITFFFIGLRIVQKKEYP
ncbi:hypothetical protein [Vagococcus fluvialis]|uniref:hypothetical protein n=1 Tax=Vagococcus fluvialis TaxID=2738 RepID=UPI0020341E80|nr:hypothetical protein [Vagococcus fluvialis]MCM2139858.1 hypothetical protein [Vagococcus fluvialis]URZ88905.1 vagococcin T immunity protein vcnE [Vagococcus fluvialis]